MRTSIVTSDLYGGGTDPAGILCIQGRVMDYLKGFSSITVVYADHHLVMFLFLGAVQVLSSENETTSM